MLLIAKFLKQVLHLFCSADQPLNLSSSSVYLLISRDCKDYHQSLVISSFIMNRARKYNFDFTHVPFAANTRKKKCHVCIGHRHYVYALSTAIPKPICHFAFVRIETTS